MKTTWLFLFGATFMLIGQTALAAPDGQAIASGGNGEGAMACSICHGSDGGGQAAAGFPRLAGLNANYLIKQLDDFASGARENSVMKPIASALSVAEREAVATYYSKLPIPDTQPDPASQKDNALGKALALRGRWSEQVPACVQCHGPHGVGVGEHFPPLAGQSATYIANQLRDWQEGVRHNDPLDLMAHVASALNDEDIQAVAEWFAAQPVTLEGGNP